MRNVAILARGHVAHTLHVPLAIISQFAGVSNNSLEIHFRPVLPFRVRNVWNRHWFWNQSHSIAPIVLVVEYVPEVRNPCFPSPCGANAVCKERNNAGSCTCLPEYYGDPYSECRPECVMNNDCSKSKACVNNKCRDPCPGVCGRNAECYVVNHSPFCSCLSGYTGNPSIACQEIPKSRCRLISFARVFHTSNWSNRVFQFRV